MPESRSTSLSTESLEALIEALGLSDDQSKNARPVKTSFTPTDSRSLLTQRPAEDSTFDEARIFGQDYLSDFDIWSDLDDDSDDGNTLPSRPGSSHESFEVIPFPSSMQHSLSPSQNPSPLYKTFNDSPIPIDPDPIYVKAAHNASIIMLRVPRNISFADLKQRLYHKFVNQEAILLSHSFSVVNVLPPPSSPQRSPQVRGERVSFAERTEMRFIDREIDWRRIVAHNDCGNKITLRILDTRP